MAAMMMRAKGGMKERRPLLGEEERRRPHQQQHENSRATTAAAAATSTTTLRLRRRWPFSSSSATAAAATTSTAPTRTTSTQRSRCVTESTTATASNSAGAATSVATTNVRTTSRSNSFKNNSDGAKSQRATTLSKATSTSQRSLPANTKDQHPRYAAPSAALGVFKSAAAASQRKSRYDDGHDEAGFFLPLHQNDPPAVSFSVASTTTTATASSFAQNLHTTNSHSTSASSALSFSNHTAGGFTSTTSGSQAAGSSSSSHSCSSKSSNSHTSQPDDEEFFATSSTWDDAASHDSTCKIQHHQENKNSSLLKKSRYDGHRQHEEKKMEEDFLFENTATASHATTTASSLTDNDHADLRQQQKQRRRSLGSSGKSSTQSSRAPSNASTMLSSSAATPSPVGPRDHGDDDDLAPARGILSKTTTPWQQQPQQPVIINPVKAILSRPLGRHTLPVAIARKWVVEVSSPEWDADEQRWKYRILVQSRRQQQQKAAQQQNLNNSSFDEQQLQAQSSSCDSTNEGYPPPGVKQARSFTAAFTWRSLADFLWLEQALRMEFHGALLLPILSIALGKPADENLEGMPVESEKLRDWLSDALNGVRGQGEWILPMGDHDTASSSSSPLPPILHAESMEAFLYRNSGPLQEEHIPIFSVPLLPVGKNNPVTPASHATPATTDTNSLHDGNGNFVGDYPPPMQQLYRSQAAAATQGQQQQSLVQQFFHRPLDFLPLELCAGPVPEHPSTPGSSREPQHQDSHSFATLSQRFNLSHSITQTPQRRRLPVEMFNCSSRALSSAPSLDVMDSFAADSSVAASPRYSSNLAIHSEVVEAERDLVLNYRATALSVMEKMQGLQQAEEDIGLAWKRLAISLSNLFAYEKDVEHAKLGDLKRTRKENMPYRKVSKKTVDDCLRVMARQKVERAVPALRALQAMLSAYVADLSAVEPSVEVYTETVRHLSLLLDNDGDDIRAENNLRGDIGLGSRPVTSWDRAKEAMRALVEKERAAKNHLVDATMEEEDVATLAQRKASQQRILHHERSLCNALATMCRATPMRVARMSWCYWNAEATQCAALHSAAHALRTEISVANKDSVSRMLKRHLREEKEDHMTELALIQRMVNLGNHHKFAQPSHQHATHSTSSVDGDAQVEITNDELGEQQENAMMRDQALLLARQRVGRWDSKLGLAIMRAIGIQDPNVRVEETTRDLRLIRKYAIGLRECLSRCIDAVDRIRAVTSEEDDDDKDENNDANASEEPKKHIGDVRKAHLVEMAKLFSGQFIDRDGLSAPKSSTPSVACLTKTGVDMSDPFGWSVVFNPDRQGTRTRLTHGRVGDLALAYLESRDHQTEWLLTSLSELLHDYYNRVETVEGYVYMECVGIQLEKYFSEKRSKALSAFEKKTDITTAINIATRKCMPKIVKELQTKLDLLGPDVSHTLVKETKEVHFESKSIKAEIHALAVRRLTRARESSTERAIALMSMWAKEEEGMAATELKSLGEAMSALERLVAQEDMGTTGYFS